jgi:hypothetical protein
MGFMTVNKAIYRKIEGFNYENTMFVHPSASLPSTSLLSIFQMYTNGFLFEFFFFVLFCLVTAAFVNTTRVSRDRLGQVLGFFVTLGFMKLSFDAACRTYSSLTT